MISITAIFTFANKLQEICFMPFFSLFSALRNLIYYKTTNEISIEVLKKCGCNEKAEIYNHL